MPRGYVLVGGRSERMGADKAKLQIAGRSLVERAVATLRPMCSEVFLCGSRPDLATYGPVLPDSREGAGPLTALVSALRHVSELGYDAFAVTLPVDVPLLPTDSCSNARTGREGGPRFLSLSSGRNLCVEFSARTWQRLLRACFMAEKAKSCERCSKLASQKKSWTWLTLPRF